MKYALLSILSVLFVSTYGQEGPGFMVSSRLDFEHFETYQGTPSEFQSFTLQAENVDYLHIDINVYDAFSRDAFEIDTDSNFTNPRSFIYVSEQFHYGTYYVRLRADAPVMKASGEVRIYSPGLEDVWIHFYNAEVYYVEHENNIQVSTIAGTGQYGYVDGGAEVAKFSSPVAIDIDSKGNIYVADHGNYCVRKITPEGVVSTLAGTNQSGYVDGNSTVAQFELLTGLTVGLDDNIYVSEYSRVRKITPEGIVSTFAGNAEGDTLDGEGQDASFLAINGLDADKEGNIYAVTNRRIRKITPEAVVSTIAGASLSTNILDGNGRYARFGGISDISVTDSGVIYVVDAGKYIRKMDTNGDVSTIAGQSYKRFDDGDALTQATFDNLSGLVAKNDGTLYLTDKYNNKVRKLSKSGYVTTLAGNGKREIIDGEGVKSGFGYPDGIVFDLEGNLIVSDQFLNRIRRIAIGEANNDLAQSPQQLILDSILVDSVSKYAKGRQVNSSCTTDAESNNTIDAFYSFTATKESMGIELKIGNPNWLVTMELVNPETYESIPNQCKKGVDAGNEIRNYTFQNLEEGKTYLLRLEIGEPNGEESIITLGSGDEFEIRFTDITVDLQEQINVNSSLLLYPNPTQSAVNIKSDDKIGLVEVFELNGRKVLSTTNQTQIDISGLESGIYYVNVFSQAGDKLSTVNVVKK